MLPGRKRKPRSLTWLPEDLEQGSIDPSLELFPAHLSTCPGTCPVLGSSPPPPRGALVLPCPPASCPPRVCLCVRIFFFLSFYTDYSPWAFPLPVFLGTHSLSVDLELPEPSFNLSSTAIVWTNVIYFPEVSALTGKFPEDEWPALGRVCRNSEAVADLPSSFPSMQCVSRLWVLPDRMRKLVNTQLPHDE